MVTLSRRGPARPDGLTFDQIAEYVANPVAFKQVKDELVDLMTRADAATAEAIGKISNANELMQKANTKAEENTQFAQLLDQRQKRMDEDETERKAQHSKLVADLNGKVRDGHAAGEAANQRERSALQREDAAKASHDRAVREADASNKERLRYMAMATELRAILEKHG